MTKPEHAARLESQTILVVEDEVLIRLLVSDELRDAGYMIVEAANATEALSYMKSNPSVTLVFTDVNMPGEMDGLGLASQIRIDFPATAIIITSGHLLPGEGLRGVPLITKPYDIADLVLQIRSHIQTFRGQDLGLVG